MKTFIAGALAAVTVAGTAIVAAPTAAEAQPYYRGGYYGGGYGYGHRFRRPYPRYGYGYGYRYRPYTYRRWGPRYAYRGYYGPRRAYGYGPYRGYRYGYGRW